MWPVSHGLWRRHPWEGSWGKRGPLSSDLNKMAWICHNVYPSIWSEKGHAFSTNNDRNKLGPAYYSTTAIVLLLLFFCAAYILYCALFSTFPSLNSQQRQRSSLPCSLNRHFLFSLPPSKHTPYTCSDNHSSVSRLHPPLCPPLLIPLFIFRILIGSPAPSCKPIQLPLLSSFA